VEEGASFARKEEASFAPKEQSGICLQHLFACNIFDFSALWSFGVVGNTCSLSPVATLAHCRL
jgi:hypothetical protein